MKTLLLVFALIVGAAAVFPGAAFSQHRDYLTDNEVDLVRDAQDIDARINVLTGAIDRRLAVLKVGTVSPKQVKQSDLWGPPPTGTRTELLDDIRKLLDKAIDDIENAVQHPVNYDIDKNRSDKQKKQDAARFPKAVNTLASSAKGYVPILKTLLDQSNDEKERGVILNALDDCQQIIEAATKTPAEAKSS